MKITKQELRKIIKEEISNVLMEQATQTDEIIPQATGEDYSKKFIALYKSAKDYETLDEYFNETYKEFKESIDLANELKKVLSNAKYDKSRTAYQFYSKMKAFTAKVDAKSAALRKINDEAWESRPFNRNAAREALHNYISFVYEVFQTEAEFIIKYVSENPDKPLPPAMRDFEQAYRNGPLKRLHQQITNIARAKASRDNHLKKMAAIDKS
jgi:hypothetical protein